MEYYLELINGSSENIKINDTDNIAVVTSAINGKATATPKRKTLKLYNYNPFYNAIVKRFRLDFEEWDYFDEKNLSVKKRSARLMTLLEMCRDYVNNADETKDVILQRDAYKRIANLYITISKADIGQHKHKQKDFDVKKSSKSEKIDNFQLDEDEPDQVDSNIPVAKELPLSNLFELMKDLDDEEILIREQSISWVKKFGKARASHYMMRYKTLGAITEDTAL